MTVITRIGRLRDCGVFRDFKWPTDLPGFGRYNLLYGWNWSGKTTISRVFRALEMRKPPPNGEVTLSANGCDITGDDFAQTNISVRVFNRDFMTESVFPVGGGDVSPIFVVGKESVEKQKKVDRLKLTRAEAETKLASQRSIKQDAERDLDKFCIDRAKVIKDTLRSSGSNTYNNYDKSNFRNRAQKMITDGHKETHRLSETDRVKLLAHHGATPKSKLQPVSYQLPPLQQIARTVAQLLVTTVVSEAIQSLKDDATLSVWVHQEAERCLFCEQTLPKDRLTAIENHFSIAYEQFLERVDAQINELQEASKNAATMALPNRAELYEDLAVDYEAAEISVRGALDSIKIFLGSLIEALTKKKNLPFDRLNLMSRSLMWTRGLLTG